MGDERSFEIGSRKFKLNKIDALKQFHIVRRMGPIMSELGPAMIEVSKDSVNLESMSQNEKLNQAAKFLGPVMNGLSKLSDEDSNKVLFGLLASVEVQQSSGNWAKVATDSSIMMQDIELPVLLQAAGRAFMFNLSGFMGAHLQTS